MKQIRYTPAIPLLICLLAFRGTLPAAPEPSVSLEKRPTTPTLSINLNAPTKPIGPLFSGLMTEEINHSYDGGLYAELIRNRAFLDHPQKSEGWSLIVPSGADAVMEITDRVPLTDKLPRSLEVRIASASDAAPVQIANSGFWGIPVNPDTTYKVSFYAKGNNPWEGKPGGAAPFYRAPLVVSIQSLDGKQVHASATTPALTGEWKKIELTLKTGKDVVPSKDNRFVISAEAPGTVHLSLVSLFPPTYKNRPNGNRTDLMEKLAALRPGFLRFPGGNFLEGNNLSDRYDWKQTRGPLEFRPGHNGCWNYRSSDGLGLLEFMEWCEDLGMEPVLAVYAGYSLRGQHLPPGPLLEPFVQDALDEIEYLTGDPLSTHWGALRAKDGHPEPFPLQYVEIGNEDWFDHSKSYDGRYTQFHDAIKARYPRLKLIATTRVTSRQPDVTDEHFYQPTDWFVKEFGHYDRTPRNGPKILVGEWAATDIPTGGKEREKRTHPTPTLREALGDSSWMCAMERNADLVIMQCYAPLLCNENPGALQWKPDLIGYDVLSSYGSPSWHAQQLFNSHRGDEVLQVNASGIDAAAPLPFSVTRDKAKGLIHVKIVNTGTSERMVRVDLGPDTRVERDAELTILSSQDPAQCNSLEHPDAVIPVTESLSDASPDYSLTLKPNSLTILTLRLK